MLLPKKVKHRKWNKGRKLSRTFESRGTEVSFGSYGLKAMSSAWLTSQQLEAARRTISNFAKREGKLWIRVFPDKPITKRPPELTMGGGKGPVDHYVAPVRPGRVLFEVDGLRPEVAMEALRLAGYKLPCKVKIVSKV